MKTYLGIDGGGTRTRALLVDGEGKKLHYIESGPSNLNSVNEDTVCHSLRELLAACIDFVDTKPITTCLGLAGATAPKLKDRLSALLTRIGYENTTLLSDAEIALEGAFPETSGILLIAGTGSACIGKNRKGDIFRTGGWGYLADDLGSASWIGQLGLQVALKQYDGREKGSEIKNTFFKKLQIEDEDDIVPKIYQPALTRADLAALAPSIISLAQEGDQQANQIKNKAIQELAKLVEGTASSIGEYNIGVAFAGGLLEHNKDFREALQKHLPNFDLIVTKNTPLEAAAQIARSSAQSQLKLK